MNVAVRIGVSQINSFILGHHDDLSRQRSGFTDSVLLLQAMGRSRFGQAKGSADEHVELLVRQPAVDVLGAAALFVRRGVEYGKAEQ